MFGLGALVAVIVLGGQGPDCRRECEAIPAETDRETCLLQCGQQETPRHDSGSTTWRREERLGGAPPGSQHEQESGTTTTVETTTADGLERTTVTTTSKRGTTVKSGERPTPSTPMTNSTTARPSTGPAPSNAAAAGPWIVLASCQTRCDGERVAKPRASCKLTCLAASPGLVMRRRPYPRVQASR